MDASIKLTRFAVNPAALPDWQQQAWPLVVTASAFNMPSEIFVYHVGMPGDPIPGDRFECVASVPQLAELPKYQGISVSLVDGIPFYRSSQLEFACRSAKEADDLWQAIIEEVNSLVANYSAFGNLLGVEQVNINGDINNVQATIAKPPSRYQLDYRPAGIPTYVDGVQGITSPDPTLPGWLPAASADPTWMKPPGAFLFYNIAQDPGLLALWPPNDPVSGHILQRNGMILPYGVVYALTKDTIWWLAFNPALIPGYQRVSPQVQDGNAPWPTDYTSPTSPGAQAPILAITLF